MSDIVTTRIFVDGERGITAAKMNDITVSSSIQPAFYTSKPTASTADPTDIALILKSGAYAQVPISALAGSATQAQIWSTRLRSFNAIGNPNFEVDQRNAGTMLVNPASGTFLSDRWKVIRAGTMGINSQQLVAGAGNVVPGTNFLISNNYLWLTLTTQQTVLGTGDHWDMVQTVEGPALRELVNDVHSLSLLVSSTVVNLKFGVTIRDVPTTTSLSKLCTIPATGNVLIQLPNLPVFASGGNWALTPGVAGYEIRICLAAGASILPAANDAWQNSNSVGAVGQSNFAASPVNSTFSVRMVVHEPGPVCSTLMDKPFTQNLDECLRHYEKSYLYGTALGTAVGSSVLFFVPAGGVNPIVPIRFKKVMAKIPTITGYSSTGAINTVRDATNAVDRAITAVQAPTDSGFAGFNVTGGAGTIWTGSFHYTADTGW